MVAFGDKVVFSGSDGGATHGAELYISDGTAAGTMIFADFRSGVAGSDPKSLFVYRGKVYANASLDGLNHQLVASDGTPAGTGAVSPLNPPMSPKGFVEFHGLLFFSAGEGTPSGVELWSTDGTSANTALVKDIYPGNASSNPGYLTVSGDVLFFGA